MRNEWPLVSIVFLAFNRRDALATSLDHVLHHLDYPADRLEVIVVADGGADTQVVGRKARPVSIRLQNEITAIPARSRLRVTLGARSTVQNIGNLVYLLPVPEGSRATVGRLTLTLPVLRKPVSP
jgi:hypothetical protein